MTVRAVTLIKSVACLRLAGVEVGFSMLPPAAPRRGRFLFWRRQRRPKRHEPEVDKLGVPGFETPSGRPAFLGIKSCRLKTEEC